MPAGYPRRAGRVHDGEGDRRARLRTRGDPRGSTPGFPSTWPSQGTGRMWRVSPPATPTRRRTGTSRSRHCSAGLHRELQGAQRSHRRQRRSGRKRARARGRDRSRGRRRHGRDQPLDRGARDRAVTRPRRARPRCRCRCRCRPGRRGRERLRRVRPRLALLARHGGEGDHGRSRHEPERLREQPRRLQRLGPDTALAPVEARHQRARRLDPRRSRTLAGRRCRARRWQALRSPAPPHC